MRITPIAVALALLAGSGSAFAETHSDFTKSYQLQTLKTFAFKQQHRFSRDPLANNDIWANDVRQALRSDFSTHGMTEATNGNPDFYVAFYVGLKDRYDINSVSYGLPLSPRLPRRLVGLAARVRRVGRAVHRVHGHRGRDRRTHEPAGMARIRQRHIEREQSGQDAVEGRGQSRVPLLPRRQGDTLAQRMMEHRADGGTGGLPRSLR